MGKGERCSAILASLPLLLHLIAGGGEKAGRLKGGKESEMRGGRALGGGKGEGE